MAAEGGFVTVVSGLPRSGTSLMMQMLHAGGLPAWADGVRAADDSNPRGYFEHEAVKRLRSDNTWLPQARGHVVKIIHLLLRELPQQAGLAYRVVFMQRPLAEVLASQQAMLAREGRPAADPAVLHKAFETQLAQVEAWLATRADIAVLRLVHAQVMQEPRAAAEQLCSFLGLPLDVAAMAAAVDPALHRQRA
ncbi:MAG: hypothetical protein JNM33_15505 [Rubrivivax sp.]|nr:hypothetical protein [Rubrivivax sp.]